MKNSKRYIKIWVLLFVICFTIVGCKKEEKPPLKMGMVVDHPQIMEDPFQYSVWRGMESFQKENEEIEIQYLESETDKEYLSNFDQLADEGNQLIFGAGLLLPDALLEAAKMNKDTNFVLMDCYFSEDKLGDNVTGIDFETEISGFLAGYIAGAVSETEKVGFVGGISYASISRFEYGYRYGVAYAAKERGVEIPVEVQYTDTFWEPLLGKNIGIEMYDNGCDVIFQAAGQSGLGVIEAAMLRDKWVIGVDTDQYEVAPHNVLTSALRCLDKATEEVAETFASGEDIGGKKFLYGLEKEAVGIPTENPNLTKHYFGLYEKTMELKVKVLEGSIVVPSNEKTFTQLMEQL